MTKTEYLLRLPKLEEIPAGMVVVHNHIRPTRHIGSRGFRIWLQPADQQHHRGHYVLPCSCDWAPELGKHYRKSTM